MKGGMGKRRHAPPRIFSAAAAALETSRLGCKCTRKRVSAGALLFNVQTPSYKKASWTTCVSWLRDVLLSLHRSRDRPQCPEGSRHPAAQSERSQSPLGSN